MLTALFVGEMFTPNPLVVVGVMLTPPLGGEISTAVDALEVGAIDIVDGFMVTAPAGGDMVTPPVVGTMLTAVAALDVGTMDTYDGAILTPPAPGEMSTAVEVVPPGLMFI
jgi:hypothetical protein